MCHIASAKTIKHLKNNYSKMCLEESVKSKGLLIKYKVKFKV